MDLCDSTGGSMRGARLPLLFQDQTEAQRAEKKFFETAPSPLSQGLDDPSNPPPLPLPLSEGLDPGSAAGFHQDQYCGA